MPFGYGIGDHHTFILNITLKSLVGVDPVKIVCPAGRRLNSTLPGIDCWKGFTRHTLESLQLKNGHNGLSALTKTARRICNVQKRHAGK